MVGLDQGYLQCCKIWSQRSGLEEAAQAERLRLFGRNLIDIQVQSIGKIFVTEVLSPFYVYSILSSGFWLADGYYYYASYILFLTFLSLVLSTYQIRVNQRRLRDKVYGSADVLVRRSGDGCLERINSSLLVPGDVICLEEQEK